MVRQKALSKKTATPQSAREINGNGGVFFLEYGGMEDLGKRTARIVTQSGIQRRMVSMGTERVPTIYAALPTIVSGKMLISGARNNELSFEKPKKRRVVRNPDPMK